MPERYSASGLVWAKWKPRAPFICSSINPGEMMAFCRSMVVTSDGRGELGIICPEEEKVIGPGTRVPFLQRRQLMNCVEDMMRILGLN